MMGLDLVIHRPPPGPVRRHWRVAVDVRETFAPEVLRLAALPVPATCAIRAGLGADEIDRVDRSLVERGCVASVSPRVLVQ